MKIFTRSKVELCDRGPVHKIIVASRLLATMIFMIASTVVNSQEIQAVAVESKIAVEGVSIRITITLDDSDSCGLSINYGDGTTSNHRIEDSSKPFIVSKSYRAKGNFQINVTGRTLIRGLNSVLACDGSASTTVQVITMAEHKQAVEAEAREARLRAEAWALAQAEAEEKARIERENRAQLEARARDEERRRAQDQELRKQEMQQLRLREAVEKGRMFAREVGDIWTLYQRKDELSGKTDQFARYQVILDQGRGEVGIDLTCRNGKISFQIIAKNLVIPAQLSRGEWYVTGRQAINDKVGPVMYSRSTNYNNVVQGEILFEPSQGLFTGTSNIDADLVSAINRLRDHMEGQELLIYRLLFEIPTSKGPVVIKIPPLANSIRALSKECSG